MSLPAILAGIQGVSSIAGVLGANSARKRAEEARQQAIRDLQGQLDQEYRQQVENNARGLYSATGTGGDAIAALGRRLGASMAGSGVYNSSATAGAVTQAQADENAALSNLAAQNHYTEQQALGRNQQYLTNLKMGVANDQIGQANNDLMGARGGLASFLGSLSQFNLRGTPTSRTAGVAMNGNQNATLPGIPPLIPTPSLRSPQVLNIPKFGYGASLKSGSLFNPFGG